MTAESQRDPQLDAAWRAQSRETPPKALDEKILAAAHRAVASEPRALAPEATRPQRWWMPLAAAAVIGAVAVGLVQLSPPELDTGVPTSAIPPAADKPPMPTDSVKAMQAEELHKKQKLDENESTANVQPATPPPPAAAPQRENKVAAQRRAEPFPAAPTSKTEADSKRSAAADSRDAQPFVADSLNQPKPAGEAGARKDAANDRQLAAPAPPPAAPAQSPLAAMRMREAGRAQGEVAAAAAPAGKNVISDEARERARDPDAWIARIRKLRDEGHADDALRELREFRSLVPDAERRLPPDLRDWKP
jgi:hypothetical protein